jgi:hypothetical protein
MTSPIASVDFLPPQAFLESPSKFHSNDKAFKGTIAFLPQPSDLYLFGRRLRENHTIQRSKGVKALCNLYQIDPLVTWLTLVFCTIYFAFIYFFSDFPSHRHLFGLLLGASILYYLQLNHYISRKIFHPLS